MRYRYFFRLCDTSFVIRYRYFFRYAKLCNKVEINTIQKNALCFMAYGDLFRSKSQNGSPKQQGIKTTEITSNAISH